MTEAELKQAEARMMESRSSVHAVKARFDKRRGRIVVQLSSGLELSFPPRLAQGLENASPEALGTTSRFRLPGWGCIGPRSMPISTSRRSCKA
jgi:hypothetical protein